MNKIEDFIIENNVLVKYVGKEEDVVIPDGVISVGKEAFSKSKIISVILPDSITTIEGDAFSWCSSLINVVMSNNVKKIGNYAFLFCRALTTINLSKNLTKIGYDVFFGCESLNNIVIPKSVKIIGRRLFEESAIKTITFEDYDNWYRTWNYSMWVNQTYGKKTDLSDPNKNAELFKFDKKEFYWFKKQF